jgi:hypothetical protein
MQETLSSGTRLALPSDAEVWSFHPAALDAVIALLARESAAP